MPQPQDHPQAAVIAELLGDVGSFAAQLGAPPSGGLAASAQMAFATTPVRDLPSLRRFLSDYRERVLVPIELPAVQRAWAHACRHETRELIALDATLRGEAGLREFAAASREVARGQLRRLRFLRDERLVQRYRDAVESGQAHGWHPLVYGVVLGVFSLPLRLGVVNYARQTLNGFIAAAGRRFTVGEPERAALLAGVCVGLPSLVEAGPGGATGATGLVQATFG